MTWKALLNRKADPEKNFYVWIRTCTERDMEKYLSRLERKNKAPKIYDMRHYTWGNGFDIIDTIRPWLWQGYGFTKGINPGDIFIKNCESGQTGKFKVIFIMYCTNPRDMFFAWVVNVGYVDPVYLKDLPDEPKK